MWVDVVNGVVHDVPLSQWERSGDAYRFKEIPVYDAPVVLAPKSLIALNA